MSLWRGYPGRLLHLETEQTRAVVENGERVGTDWYTHCGRWLRMFWDERSWSADIPRDWPVTPFDVDGRRRVCLTCWYRALTQALVIIDWKPSFREFARLVERGYMPGIPGWRNA